MAGRLEDKVALISGAARGQGRSHAVRLAQEGADIIAFDLCRQLDTVPYPLATPEDLAETVKLVEELDRRIVAREADVRDSAAVQALVDEGVREFGRLDVVCANAGIGGVVENTWTMTEDQWEEMIAVDLTGVWKTVKAAVPAMIEAGNGGSIIITSSAAGLKGMTGAAHYVSAKHGLVGLMRTLANELAPHFIRVNTVHPTGVNTPMVVNDFMAQVLSSSDGTINLQNALPDDCGDVIPQGCDATRRTTRGADKRLNRPEPGASQARASANAATSRRAIRPIAEDRRVSNHAETRRPRWRP